MFFKHPSTQNDERYAFFDSGTLEKSPNVIAAKNEGKRKFGHFSAENIGFIKKRTLFVPKLGKCAKANKSKDKHDQSMSQ